MGRIYPHLTHCAFIITCYYESKCIVVRVIFPYTNFAAFNGAGMTSHFKNHLVPWNVN